jgi:serine/threonine protein phosphatase PrpC
MVLVQWLERGLGQILAPDSNYKPDPEAVDTRSNFWSFVAPDPNFTGDNNSNKNNVSDAATVEDNTVIDAAKTPTPKNKSSRRRRAKFDNDDNEIIQIDENRDILMTPSKGGEYNLLQKARIKNNEDYNSDEEDEEEEDNVDLRVLQTARALANFMASPTATRTSASTVLRYCATASKLGISDANKRVLRKLLKADSTIFEARTMKMNHACPDGYSPLMATAHANNVIAAEILLEIGSVDQLKETNLQGKTAYHIAAECGHVEMLSFLQAKHYDAFGINSAPPLDLTGMTPLGVAITSPATKAITNKKLIYNQLFTPSDVSIMGSPVPLYQRVTYSRTLSLAYGVSQMPGKRVLMEDSSVASCWDTAAVFAVCDGHSDGGQVSKFVVESFPSKFRQSLKSIETMSTPPQSTSSQNIDWHTICTDICTSTDTRLKDSKLAGGSTAVIAIVTATEIVCANVGDCRCILVQQQQQEQEEPIIEVVPLSDDHKANTEIEINRIKNAGLNVAVESFQDATGETISISKVVLSDDNKMACSRTFGDFEYKANKTLADSEQAVVAVPDVTVHPRDALRDQFLILACDGIWDVMSSDEVGQFVLNAISTQLDNNIETNEANNNNNRNGIVALPTIGDQKII